jgi:phage repressor protein C with HTH and peptisase S24 domain
MQFEEFYRRVQKITGITSQKELAQVLGIGPAAVTLAKKRGVPKSWSLQVASLFNLNPEWLQSGEGPVRTPSSRNAFFVPKVSAKACAGGGSLEVRDNTVEEIPFTESWLRRRGSPNSMVIMDVIGDSMSPELEPGDSVLVDQSQKQLTNRDVFVVSLEDALHVKRFQCARDLVILLSTNQRYSPVTLQGQEIDTLQVIGRVLWSSRVY